MTVVLNGLDGISALVGQPFEPGEWVTVDQDRIDDFARVTGDRQWIHVDPARAKSGPFGRTIAHGMLTLSMIAALNTDVFRFEGFGMGVNYGFQKVRFPTPVPVGSRVRLGGQVLSCEELKDGIVQTIIEFAVEREGADKPACVAEMIFRHYPARA